MTTTRFRYVIFSSQRTGSTYLCSRLFNIKDRFGLPMEYLNPRMLKPISHELSEAVEAGGTDFGLDSHLRKVEELRTTDDGMFGIKVQPLQLEQLTPPGDTSVIKFLSGYDKVLTLSRKSKIDQAVSGAIAQASGKWFGDGEDSRVDKSALDTLCPDVAARVNQSVQEELLMRRTVREAGRPALHLFYEEMENEPERSVDRVLKFLGEPRGSVGLEISNRHRVPAKDSRSVHKALKEKYMAFVDGNYIKG